MFALKLIRFLTSRDSCNKFTELCNDFIWKAPHLCKVIFELKTYQFKKIKSEILQKINLPKTN